MAWSDPPFFTFSFAAFILLICHIARPRTMLLVLAALMTGYAIIIRYAGVALLPPMVIALLFFGSQPLAQRIKDTVIAAVFAVIPLGLWLARNVMIGNKTSDLSVSVHLFGFEQAKKLISVISKFIISNESVSIWLRTFIIGVIAALFMTGLVLLLRKNYFSRVTTSGSVVLPTICTIYFIVYILFFAFMISLVSAYIWLDARYIFPAMLPLLVAGISVAWAIPHVVNKMFVWPIFIIGTFCVVGANLKPAITEALDIQQNGREYTSRIWRNSETMSYIATTPDTRHIYSNGPDIIRFKNNVDASFLPNRSDPHTLKPNHEYDSQVYKITRECREGKALVVYLSGVSFRFYIPSSEEFEAKSGLPVLRRFKDGVIYGVPAK
jgi:hypothetical protein